MYIGLVWCLVPSDARPECDSGRPTVMSELGTLENLRITASAVVHGNLAIHKPLDCWVAVDAVLLTQVSFLGGINLQSGTTIASMHH